MQGVSISSKEPNTLGVSAFMSCGRGSDLCSLYVRMPKHYFEAYVLYDKSNKRDNDFGVSLPVYDWDEKEIKSRFRTASATETALLPRFRGVHFMTTKAMSKHMTLQIKDEDGCELIENQDLSGWMH